MIPQAKKAERKRQEDSKQANCFFDAPYGSTVCNCGGKVIAQGRCQTCYDKFMRGVKGEHTQMKKDIKDEDAAHKKQWRLF